GADAVEVSLRTRGGVLVVPVMASDGTELAFALSTGSTGTVASESGRARIGEGGTLTLGGLPVPTESIHTVPDERLTVEGTLLDGMVGANMLNGFDILVDVPGGRLALRPVGRSPEWEGAGLGEPVLLRVYHGIVLGLDVEVNGTGYPAMLDLGTPSLLINERVKEEAGVEGGRARSVRVGAATFTDLPAELSDHPVFHRFSPAGDGFVIVGAAVALDCALSISWVHRELRTCG
ncbi:MAG: hypothetical protein GWO00_19720, partial [Gemmatimonadetes bacterium]|nr:hypothetical protein [Gemmatimonadota bacterium]